MGTSKGGAQKQTLSELSLLSKYGRHHHFQWYPLSLFRSPSVDIPYLAASGIPTRRVILIFSEIQLIYNYRIENFLQYFLVLRPPHSFICLGRPRSSLNGSVCQLTCCLTQGNWTLVSANSPIQYARWITVQEKLLIIFNTSSTTGWFVFWESTGIAASVLSTKSSKLSGS